MLLWIRHWLTGLSKKQSKRIRYYCRIRKIAFIVYFYHEKRNRITDDLINFHFLKLKKGGLKIQIKYLQYIWVDSACLLSESLFAKRVLRLRFIRNSWREDVKQKKRKEGTLKRSSIPLRSSTTNSSTSFCVRGIWRANNL